ncbi:MAG: TatD DNase family protein [Actinomycetota bacterium]|nr:TatD DNase family protein [Actinomycetota bacterium]
MWFDSHCHLFDVDDPAAAVQRARAAGVGGMLTLGVDPVTSRKCAELAATEGVVAGAAWHPEGVKGWADEWAAEIEMILELDEVVAVGETGIDLHWDTSYFDDQVNAFKRHIELAKDHSKPLVIHTRNSVDETCAVLEEMRPPHKLVFHCWSGTERQLARALALGAMVSFAGNVSFKNASDLREVAVQVPPDRLLVETDSPYLAPVPHRGKPNEPAHVALVGAALAAARNQDATELAELTTKNALRLFSLD